MIGKTISHYKILEKLASLLLMSSIFITLHLHAQAPQLINDRGKSNQTPATLGAKSPRQPLEVFEIQGANLTSPQIDQVVMTENNVVTAVASDGFFIQTPTDRTDGNAETSDGIFVFVGSTPSVSVGDLVDVEGRVMEVDGLTEIGDSPTVTVRSSGNSLPAPVEFDDTMPSPDQPQPENEFERYEGMLIEVVKGRATGPSRLSGNVRIVAGSQRAFREPGIAFPGLLKLPVWDGNPEIFQLDPDGLGLPDLLIPAGAELSLAVGPLVHRNGAYQLLPTEITVDTAIEPRPVRERNAGEYIIATQNIRAFVDDEDDPNKNEHVLPPEEFANRLNKLSVHIREVLRAPDILAVQEIEGQGVLEKLAAKIQQDDATLIYTAFVDERSPFEPDSRVNLGLLVRNTVQVDSVIQIGRDATFAFDGRTEPTHFRPPLVLYGKFNTTPQFPVVVMVIHNKSLGGIEGSNAGLVRTRRFEEALSISKQIQKMQEQSPDINLVVTGDFNAFEFTDGYVDMIGQITGNLDQAGAQFAGTDVVNPDLINQVLTLSPEERYSFVFQGSASVLDHMLNTQALQPFVSEIAYARGNADAPNSLERDGTTPLRASDHDGLVLFLNLNIVSVEDGDGQSDLPSAFGLSQNYPNPFNPSTTITFAVPEAVEVTLAIYNLRGQLIQILHSGPIAAGQHNVVWDGRDSRAAKVASGIYMYKLQAKDFVATRKLVFTK